ncbi:hypothetical protein [Pseudobutyrivibrio sp. LB2011]|uniref:hypothetical protein n=1 Tax=Pseudobutyrivibrio sp. LB2011 TaxID=1408312 RepID=UPI0005D1C338|nr:hypothetical protein [Pseudobutyrivibrio sp. LB2011]
MEKTKFKIYDVTIKDHSKDYDDWYAKGTTFYEYVTEMSQPEKWFIENTMAQIEYMPEQEEILRKSIIFYIYIDIEQESPYCDKNDSKNLVTEYWTKPEKHMPPLKRYKFFLTTVPRSNLYLAFTICLSNLLTIAILLAKHGLELLALNGVVFMVVSTVVIVFEWILEIEMGIEIYRRELDDSLDY